MVWCHGSRGCGCSVGDCGYDVRRCVPRRPNYHRASRNAIDAAVVIVVIERLDDECDYVNEYGYRITFLIIDASHGEHSAGYDEYDSYCSRGAHSYWHLGRYQQECGLRSIIVILVLVLFTTVTYYCRLS